MAEELTTAEEPTTDYGVAEVKATARMTAPRLPYKPIDPKRYNPPIGLIACGGITQSHLKAYKSAGYNIVALCDVHEERAKARQKDFYPDAEVYADYRDVLKRDDVEVVD